MSDSADYDDEYTPITTPVMPMAIVPGGVFGGWSAEHVFEVQALRDMMQKLSSENDNLRAENTSLRQQLEVCEDVD